MADYTQKNNKNGVPVSEIDKKKKISTVSLMFFVVSFLGWCMEVVFCSSGLKNFNNRGFLTLPFCVIYGAPLCLIFLMIGTPREGALAAAVERTSLGRGGKIFLRYALYFLLTASIATLFELVFGFVFDKLGIWLWSYHRFPLNYKGYICLYFSLIWGFLITAFMSVAWKPLYKLLSLVPNGIAGTLNMILWFAVILDFSFNFGYLIIEKKHFELIFAALSRRR